MTITYTDAEITDEATDADSPVNETLMQGIARAHNYLRDVVLAAGANSERVGWILTQKGEGENQPLMVAGDSDEIFSWYVYIPTQWDGISVSYRITAYWDADSDATDRIDLTIGGAAAETLEKTADFGVGGTSAGEGTATGSVDPVDTGLIQITVETQNIGADDSVTIYELLIYYPST